MEFQIIFFKEADGKSPIEEFLLGLVKTNKDLFNEASKGIEKLKHRVYHREPLSKYLESGLWELRIKSGTNILRIVFTFYKGQLIILLHIFIKKQQKTPANELEVARKRLKELKERLLL